VTAALVAGVVCLVPVHLAHATHWNEWLFSWRPGLPFWLLVVPSVGWLVTALEPRVGRLAVVAGVVVVAAYAAQTLPDVLELRREAHAGDAAVRELSVWIDAQPRRHAVLASQPQPLAIHSRAAFQWTSCWDDPEYVAALVRRAPIDLVVVPRHEIECASLDPLRERLVPVATIAGYAAFRLREEEGRRTGDDRAR
jgi:hypothetical protein